MANESMRRLLSVPILHTQADMGSVSEFVSSLYNQKLGERERERHVKTVDDIWKAIRNKINRNISAQ